MTIKQLNDSVLKDLYLNGEKNLGKQFYYEYPESNIVQGREIPLKNIDRYGYKSLDDFYWKYGRAIDFNQATHDRIMNALRYAKANDMIHSSIVDFLRLGWWAVEKSMKGEI